MSGLNTCLVIHSQDPAAEYLLNCKIGPSPVTCSDNLSVVRLETTKVSSHVRTWALPLSTFASRPSDEAVLSIADDP